MLKLVVRFAMRFEISLVITGHANLMAQNLTPAQHAYLKATIMEQRTPIFRLCQFIAVKQYLATAVLAAVVPSKAAEERARGALVNQR
jgi:hypothetical protein